MNKLMPIFLGISLIILTFHTGCIDDEKNLHIDVFSANPTAIAPGEKTTLSWVVTGAVKVEITPYVGNVSHVGSTIIALNESTTFTLMASNSSDSISKKITVIVQPIDDIESIIIDNTGFENAAQDPYDIHNVSVNMGLIHFTIGYSGGCKNHSFQLYAKEEFMESDPVQVDIMLSHDDKDDLCEAYVRDTIVFDLTALKQKWQNEYQKQSGTIIMHIENHTEAIRYSFGQALFSFLNVSITTNRKVYGINETIDISIFVENLKKQNVTLEFPSSQTADFSCTNEQGETVYTWSHDRGFASVITPVTIPGNSTIEIFNISWSRMSNAGKVLDDGAYYLQGWLPGFYYQDENINYSTSPGPHIYSEPIELTFV